jgi:hypothetical protein
MTFGMIVNLILAALKFWPSILQFIEILQGTPEEKHAELLSKLRAASSKADETKGDTSGYEDIFSGK